jgi:prepilin-type N-terminal cleavage/methylation domain-containing protein
LNYETRETHEMKTRTGKQGFTLIELLVVIVIIGVLFAVAMPVFENAGRKDTERAAAQLIGTMRLARQHAINKRQWAIVVFPDAYSGNYTGAGGDTVDKCLRSYAVLGVTGVQNVAGAISIEELERPDQIPQNMTFEFISDWKYLPEGIYFDDDLKLGANIFTNPPLPAATFSYPVNPTTPQTRVRQMGAVLFKPNGRAYAQINSTTGKYWQDTDTMKMKIHITSAKYYEVAGGTLSAAKPVPGTNTVVQVRNKTGQVQIWDGASFSD